MAKISVLIPVYNGEKYLERCINSVVNQTFKDIEIICIDNHSEDNSGRIADEFAKRDDRITVIHNDKNYGSSYSRNLALETAKGKYISFVDADDYIDEKYLECMFNKIEQINCDIVLNLSIYNNVNGTEKPRNLYTDIDNKKERQP